MQRIATDLTVERQEEPEVIDDEFDTEERAERLINAERQLEEAYERKGEAEEDGIHFDLSAERFNYRSIHRAEVVGGERKGALMKFTVLYEGEERTVNLPWPNDPADNEEPLVRVAEWDGAGIRRIADIDHITVVEVDDDLHTVVPPASYTSVPVTVSLPHGGTTSSSFSRPPEGFIRRAVTRLSL